MKIKLITLLLLCLWIPVSIDKFLAFKVFQQSLVRQPFDDNVAHLLAYVLPALEALTVLLLLIESLRRMGMLLSLALMSAFTLYIGAALAGAWEKLPCGCGSVISSLTWKQHLFFNIFFLLVSGYGVLLTNQKRSGAVGGEAAEGGPA
jgi:putative oxidoreductase